MKKNSIIVDIIQEFRKTNPTISTDETLDLIESELLKITINIVKKSFSHTNLELDTFKKKIQELRERRMSARVRRN